MILSKFKEKRIRKKIDKKLLEIEKSIISSSNNKIHSIIVFTDKNIDEKITKTIAESLEVDESIILNLVFVKKISKENISENDFSENDIGILGNIKSERILKVINKEFDLLINFSKDNLHLDCLTVNSKAKFKVGHSKSDNRLYDFMIDIDDITVFISELKKYLKILNKIECNNFLEQE